MVNVEKCPPGTTTRQLQGVVEVQDWGTLLLELDGVDGKTLIVSNINVNLFSLQRVVKNGFLLIYGEVEG